MASALVERILSDVPSAALRDRSRGAFQWSRGVSRVLYPRFERHGAGTLCNIAQENLDPQAGERLLQRRVSLVFYRDDSRPESFRRTPSLPHEAL